MKRVDRIGIIIFSVMLNLSFTLVALLNHRSIGDLRSQEVADKVLPTMVQIGVSMSGDSSVKTIASGVLVSNRGYVLTVKHAVDDVAHVYIKTHHGDMFRASYFIADAHRDLAIVKFVPILEEISIDVTKGQVASKSFVALNSIKINHKEIAPGQEIMAFGFPAHDSLGGGAATVSRGVVSGVNRTVFEPMASGIEERKISRDLAIERAIEIGATLMGIGRPRTPSMLQVDVMVNPGSSGGAIVNMEGELIGICNSMITSTGANIGINLAIPVSEASDILRVIGIWED